MKMKIILFAAVFVCTDVYAQEIKVSDLYVPMSPGFVLADKAPSSVEKPSTPKAFGISLLNLIEGGAIEATPYWIVNHPAYTFEDLFKKRFPLIETFNVSVATFKTDSLSSVSMGFRTQLLRIYSKQNQAGLLNKKKELVDLLSVEEFTPEDLEKIEKARKELQELKSKPCLNIEIAAAIIGSSISNSFKGLASNKSGVWANVRFRPGKFPLDITGLSRYSWANNANPKIGTDTAFLDFGLSLSLQKTKFDFALEYINRHDFSIKGNSERLAFVVNYMLSDNIILVGSLGKNFDKVNNIITVFGAKFGISNEKLKLN